MQAKTTLKNGQRFLGDGQRFLIEENKVCEVDEVMR